MDIEKVKSQSQEWADLLGRAQTAMMRAGQLSVDKAVGEEYSLVDFTSVMNAYLTALPQLIADPVRTMQSVQTYWMNWANAWQEAWSGEKPGAQDKRFRDKTWDEEPVLRGLKDSHIALENAVEDFLDGLPEGSKDSLKVKFFTRQMMSALSPANQLLINPAAREKLVETEGQSVLDGFRNLVEDLERGEGRLDIATNDPTAFVVGRDLAATPGKVIYENELMQLIHYAPLTETQKKRPLIFVPPWINKFYIFDMRPDNSMVRFMLEQGHSVFLISWVNERLQTSQQSTELQQLNDTIEDIIQESTDGDGQINEAAPQPAPTVIYVPVPDNGGDDNNGSGGPVQVPPVSSGPTTYVVQSGDTLSGIAGKFGTTVNDLMLVNGLTNYLIYEGQQLSIPAR